MRVFVYGGRPRRKNTLRTLQCTVNEAGGGIEPVCTKTPCMFETQLVQLTGDLRLHTRDKSVEAQQSERQE